MNIITISEWHLWGISDMRADDFHALVDALVASGDACRHKGDISLRNLKVLAIFTGRPRRRK